MSKSKAVLPEYVQLMDPGVLCPFVAAFTSRLLSLGHTRLTVSGYEASARHFGQWLQSAKIAVAEIDDSVVRRFARHRWRCPGIRRADRLSTDYVNRAHRFVNFLAECGVVTPLTQEAPRAHDDQVLAFQTWLRRHRGISERSLAFRTTLAFRRGLIPILVGVHLGSYPLGIIRIRRGSHVLRHMFDDFGQLVPLLGHLDIRCPHRPSVTKFANWCRCLASFIERSAVESSVNGAPRRVSGVPPPS